MTINAHGTQIKRGDAADPEVFTSVGAIMDISGPQRRNETTDTTSHDSTAREFLATLRDEGEVSTEVLYDGANNTEHAGLRTDFEGKTLRNWQIQLPNSGPSFAFAAYVTELGAELPVGDKYSRSLTLRISGSVTEADS